MPLKLRWLAIIGAIVLAIGLYLAFDRRAQYYPGLVIVVGCVTLAVFGLANHDPRGERKRQDRTTSPAVNVDAPAPASPPHSP
jgi:hypothetical protein